MTNAIVLNKQFTYTVSIEQDTEFRRKPSLVTKRNATVNIGQIIDMRQNKSNSMYRSTPVYHHYCYIDQSRKAQTPWRNDLLIHIK